MAIGMFSHPFALNIGEKYARWILLHPKKQRNNLYTIKSWGEVPLPPGCITAQKITDQEKLAIFLANTLKHAKGIHHHEGIALSLPEPMTFILTSNTASNDTKALVQEIERQIPFATDHINYSTIDLNNAATATTLIAATTVKASEIYASCVEKAGYIPLLIEPQSFAVVRSLTPDVPWQEPVGILHFDETYLTIIIAYEGVPLISLTNALTSEHGNGENTLDSITHFLGSTWSASQQFFRNRFPKLPPIKSVFLSGVAPSPKTLATKLSQELHIEVLPGNPMIHIAPAKKTIPENLAMHFTTAIGLAIALDKMRV